MKSALFLSALLCTLACSAPVSAAAMPSENKKISVDFQNIDIRTVLQILAKESGLNIVADDRVNGKITLTLHHIPWHQALDLVLQAKNLAMQRRGNTILVLPRSELLKQSQEAGQAVPLATRTFHLKYRNAEYLAKLLKAENGSDKTDGGIVSARGSLRADAPSNTLIATDHAAALQRLSALLAELDVPAEQVMIEAKIVEASEGLSRALGVKFGFTGATSRHAWSNNLDNAWDNRNAHNDFRRGNAPNAEYALGPNVNLPVLAATGSVALIRSLSSGALGLELAAQQAQNRARIVSSPRILTQNRKEAVIEAGTEIPYEESTSSGATSVSFKKAVLGLTVTPSITPDGQILMEIKVNKDSVDEGCTASEPCIRTQKLQTGAMVENGGTLVLGGIYEESSSNAVRKVPLLGDIPYVGNLFKYRARNQSHNELLVFITPRIIGRGGEAF
ncbi:MAG: type IV pilus secretin PilQ [Neisseria sp.]|nr:type IV pilus secretin PilQ [Neisseria sp.]